MRETMRKRLAAMADRLRSRLKCGGEGSNKPGPCPEGEEGSKPSKPSSGGGRRPGGSGKPASGGKPSGYAVAQRLAAGLARLPECSRKAAEAMAQRLYAAASAKYGEAAAREVASSALVGVTRITTVGELLAVAGLASLVKSFGGESPAGNRVAANRNAAPASPDMGDPKVRATLMADLLGGTLGEDALLAFQGAPRAKTWNPADHPRGKGGRFIPKGSAEAVASAKKELAAAKGKKHTPESAAKVLSHLNLLTVKQLKELRKELGLKAPGGLRAQLVKNIHERLTGSVDVETQKPQAKPKKKPEPNPEENPSALPREPQGKILPDRPIAERLAAYHYGKALAENIAKTGESTEQARLKFRSARIERERTQKLYGEALAAQDEALKVDGKASPKLRDAAKKAREVWLKAQQAEEDANKAHTEARKAQREAVDKLLRVSDPVKFAHEKDPGLPPDQHEKADIAAAWVQSITSGGIKLLPVQHKNTKSGRASYHGPLLAEPKGTIYTEAYGLQTSMVHEYGHHLENTLHGAQAAAQEFLKYRVGNESPANLSEKFPDSGYTAQETGRQDEFGRYFGKDSNRAYYVGKDYGKRDTEIISMGIEALYNDPAGFCSKDPEYAAFVIGVLRGHLRK